MLGMPCRRKFPAVSGGVIEDVKFVGNDRVLCCYYGGVILHSTQPGGFGVQLEWVPSSLRYTVSCHAPAVWGAVLCKRDVPS